MICDYVTLIVYKCTLRHTTLTPVHTHISETPTRALIANTDTHVTAEVLRRDAATSFRISIRPHACTYRVLVPCSKCSVHFVHHDQTHASNNMTRHAIAPRVPDVYYACVCECINELNCPLSD